MINFEFIVMDISQRAEKVSTGHLWRCYLKFTCPRWILGGVLRLLTDLVGFVAPLSVNVILTYVAHTNERVDSQLLVNGTQTSSSSTPSSFLTTPRPLAFGASSHQLVATAGNVSSVFGAVHSPVKGR
jgi:hypothetical protein